MDTYERLKHDLLTCRSCERYFSHVPKPIFQGSEHAKIMQISQAPSRAVMESGKPFDDVSGRKLKQDWYQISEEAFYDLDNFYITSIGRCYPGKAVKGSGDLPPNERCADRFLKRELALLHPQLYIVIGSYAASYIFGKERALEELIFHDQSIQGTKALVLPHPSPLNRKWLRDHPTFESERMPEIRAYLHHILEQ